MMNKQRTLLLMGRGGSSVVVDYLCSWAAGQDMAVACFYYDFASREAQSPTNMLALSSVNFWVGWRQFRGKLGRNFGARRSCLVAEDCNFLIL